MCFWETCRSRVTTLRKLMYCWVADGKVTDHRYRASTSSICITKSRPLEIDAFRLAEINGCCHKLTAGATQARGERCLPVPSQSVSGLLHLPSTDACLPQPPTVASRLPPPQPPPIPRPLLRYQNRGLLSHACFLVSRLLRNRLQACSS